MPTTLPASAHACYVADTVGITDDFDRKWFGFDR